MFKDITVVQSKYNKRQIEPKGYWHFAWHFKYKGDKYGNTIDNCKRDDNIFGTWSGIIDRELTCDIQIAMLEKMLETMKRLNKEVIK